VYEEPSLPVRDPSFGNFPDVVPPKSFEELALADADSINIHLEDSDYDLNTLNDDLPDALLY